MTGNNKWKMKNLKIKKSRVQSYEIMTGLLFIAPVTLLLIIFKYIPVLYSVILSLHRGSLLNPLAKWYALENYAFVLNNPYAIRGFVNTFIYTLIYVPGAVIFSMTLGLLVSKEFKGKSFFRVAYYTPVVISIVAAVQVWAWILNPSKYGIANSILLRLGIGMLDWLHHPDTALISLVIIGLWNVGLNMLIFLAAIKNIPYQLYESAEIDGAGRWGQFWNITLPMLKPTIYFVSITSTILALKLFQPVLLLTRGGPLNSTTTVAYQIYEQGFQFSRWGRASAQATIFFIIVLIITMVQYKIIPESSD
jgi:ABC-type sugar transport system permease subunit